MTKTVDDDLHRHSSNIHDDGNDRRNNTNNNNNNYSSSSSSSSSNNKHSESNPFIRFKQTVDSSIHSALSTLRGSSAAGAGDSRSRDPDNATSGTTPTPTTTAMTTSRTGTDMSFSMLTPSEQHIESRIALLAGGTPAEASLAWRLFLTRSAYSPLRLEHDPELGRPGRKPVPRDVDLSLPSSSSSSSSNEWDRDNWPWDVIDTPRTSSSPSSSSSSAAAAAATAGSEFGWLEAFEDLMRVSSGLELSDLNRRRRENQQHHHFGLLSWGGFDHFLHPVPWGWHDRWGWGGGGMREMAWLGRMHRHGLTEVLFPVYDPDMGYQSPRTMAEWVERRRAEEKREKEAGRAWEELMGEKRRAIEEADAWLEEVKKDMRKEFDSWRDAADEKGSSFFDGIGGIVKTLGKVLEDEVKSLQHFGKERAKKHKDEGDVENQKASPETETDLYSIIQSAFHESERSLSNFFKSISEARHSGFQSEPKPASPPRVDTTEVVENGITKKTTKKEFVDEHGNTHSKTETTWTDERGNVIFKQVHSSMGRTDRWEKTIAPAHAKNDTEMSREPKEPKESKEGGWFWK